MSTAGPSLPGAGASDSAVGSVAWSNADRVTTSDDSYATATGSGGALTHYLKGTGLGFSVPSGATIDGVAVSIARKADTSGVARYVYDNTVKLVVGGAVGGDNKAATGTKWPTTEASASYGGSADTWGLTLTREQVNAADFGVVLAVNLYGLSGVTASVDALWVTVTYTAGGTSVTVTAAVSDLALEAPAGAIGGQRQPAVAAVVSDLALEAPAGLVSGQRQPMVAAVVSDLALEAPAGVIDGQRQPAVAAAVSDCGADAPAGLVSGQRQPVVAAVVSDCGADAPAGLVSGQRQPVVTAVVSDLALEAPAGAISGQRQPVIVAVIGEAGGDAAAPAVLGALSALILAAVGDLAGRADVALVYVAPARIGGVGAAAGGLGVAVRGGLAVTVAAGAVVVIAAAGGVQAEAEAGAVEVTMP